MRLLRDIGGVSDEAAGEDAPGRAAWGGLWNGRPSRRSWTS